MRIAVDEAWNCNRDDDSRRVAGLSGVAEPFFVCWEGGLDQRGLAWARSYFGATDLERRRESGTSGAGRR